MKKPYRRPEISNHPLPSDDRRRRILSGELEPDRGTSDPRHTREEAF